MKAIVLTACCVMSIACTVPPAPVPLFVPFTTQTYRQTNTVEVLYSKPPGKPYVELGELSIRLNKASAESWVLLLRAKAQEIGADAIVLLGDRPAGSIAVPAGPIAVAVPLRDKVALAIKYTD